MGRIEIKCLSKQTRMFPWAIAPHCGGTLEGKVVLKKPLFHKGVEGNWENLYQNEHQVVRLGRINREQMPKTSCDFQVLGNAVSKAGSVNKRKAFAECSKSNVKPVIPVKKLFRT